MSKEIDHMTDQSYNPTYLIPPDNKLDSQVTNVVAEAMILIKDVILATIRFIPFPKTFINCYREKLKCIFSYLEVYSK